MTETIDPNRRTLAARLSIAFDEAKNLAEISEGRDPRGEEAFARARSALATIRDRVIGRDSTPLSVEDADEVTLVVRDFESAAAACSSPALQVDIQHLASSIWQIFWDMDAAPGSDGRMRFPV